MLNTHKEIWTGHKFPICWHSEMKVKTSGVHLNAALSFLFDEILKETKLNGFFPFRDSQQIYYWLNNEKPLKQLIMWLILTRTVLKIINMSSHILFVSTVSLDWVNVERKPPASERWMNLSTLPWSHIREVTADIKHFLSSSAADVTDTHTHLHKHCPDL